MCWTDCHKGVAYNVTFVSLDGAKKQMAMQWPLPSYYVFPILKPYIPQWIPSEDLMPMKTRIENRQYQLDKWDIRYHTAEYREVWHECGTEAAVERALIQQKEQFKKYFDKFNKQLFEQDSDLKSESGKESFRGHGDRFCPGCDKWLSCENDKKC